MSNNTNEKKMACQLKKTDKHLIMGADDQLIDHLKKIINFHGVARRCNTCWYFGSGKGSSDNLCNALRMGTSILSMHTTSNSVCDYWEDGMEDNYF